MSTQPTRRRFLANSAMTGAALATGGTLAAAEKPALLGGKPVRKGAFPRWPVFDGTEPEELAKVLRSGRWYRGNGQAVRRFEETYCKYLGAKRGLATSSGTGALLTSLQALDVQPGDEVLLPSYTFVACVNVVLARFALPVFVDVDPETFLMDPKRAEAAITDRTTAFMPVHIGGSPVDLDAFLALSRKRKIPVMEDACQAHGAEWRGRKVGTYGVTGNFSFQASKNLNCGEGGFVVTNDEELYERCYAYHWNGNSPTGKATKHPGSKFMMTEFEAALLQVQLSRLEEQSRKRTENAEHLIKLLREIPGLAPARQYEGCTRNSYHLFMLRYDKRAFADLPRATFLKALSAEGIPASGGYRPLHKEAFIRDSLENRGFQRIFSKDRIAGWNERNVCAATDQLCNEAVWLTQNVLLGTRDDMNLIADAVRKIHRHAGDLAKM